MSVALDYKNMSIVVNWFARNSAVVSLSSALCLFCITYGGRGVLWAAMVCTYGLIMLSVLRAAYAIKLSTMVSAWFTNQRVLLTVLAGVCVMKSTVDYIHKQKALVNFQNLSSKANKSIDSLVHSKFFHIFLEIIVTILTHLVVTYFMHHTFSLTGFVWHFVNHFVDTAFWLAASLTPIAVPTCLAVVFMLYTLLDVCAWYISSAVMLCTSSYLYLSFYDPALALTFVTQLGFLAGYSGLVCSFCSLLVTGFALRPLLRNIFSDEGHEKPAMALLAAPLYLLVFSQDSLVFMINSFNSLSTPYTGVMALSCVLALMSAIGLAVGERVKTATPQPLCFHDFRLNSWFGKFQIMALHASYFTGLLALAHRRSVANHYSTLTKVVTAVYNFFEPYCKSISLLSASSFAVILVTDLLQPTRSKNIPSKALAKPALKPNPSVDASSQKDFSIA